MDDKETTVVWIKQSELADEVRALMDFFHKTRSLPPEKAVCVAITMIKHVTGAEKLSDLEEKSVERDFPDGFVPNENLDPDAEVH